MVSLPSSDFAKNAASPLAGRTCTLGDAKALHRWLRLLSPLPSAEGSGAAAGFAVGLRLRLWRSGFRSRPRRAFLAPGRRAPGAMPRPLTSGSGLAGARPARRAGSGRLGCGAAVRGLLGAGTPRPRRCQALDLGLGFGRCFCAPRRSASAVAAWAARLSWRLARRPRRSRALDLGLGGGLLLGSRRFGGRPRPSSRRDAWRRRQCRAPWRAVRRPLRAFVGRGSVRGGGLLGARTLRASSDAEPGDGLGCPVASVAAAAAAPARPRLSSLGLDRGVRTPRRGRRAPRCFLCRGALLGQRHRCSCPASPAAAEPRRAPRPWATSLAAATSSTPSVIITRQNGQPVAIVDAPVSSASSARSWLTRLPMCSSIHIRAPPAPQHRPRSAWRGISVSFAPDAPISSRGAS